jgi:chromosome segregation ATPase
MCCYCASDNPSFKITTENISLRQRIEELVKVVDEDAETKAIYMKQRQEDALEILTLKKACQLQKQDIETLDKAFSDLENSLKLNQSEAEDTLAKTKTKFESDRANLVSHYEGEIGKQEEAFLEERNRLKEQLHNVVSNEVNLINRIKCLEAEEGYSHAEVERILNKEREMNEKQQEHLYKIECLEGDLKQAQNQIEEAQSQVVIQRSEDDVEKIAEQGETIRKLESDASYLRQELIEARARKSASDDELGTMKGKLETLENNITALSNESELTG